MNTDGMNSEQVDKWKQDLLFIQNLTPGDFATVQRQVRLLGEPLAPERWIQALTAEARAKLVGQRAMEVLSNANRTLQ